MEGGIHSSVMSASFNLRDCRLLGSSVCRFPFLRDLVTNCSFDFLLLYHLDSVIIGGYYKTGVSDIVLSL